MDVTPSELLILQPSPPSPSHSHPRRYCCYSSRLIRRTCHKWWWRVSESNMAWETARWKTCIDTLFPHVYYILQKIDNCQTKKLNCLFTCYIFSGVFFIYIIVYTKDWAVDLSSSCIHTLSCSAFHRAQCSNRHPIIWTGCGRHYRERDLIYISVSLRDCNAQQHVNTHNTFPTIWPWRHCARCCVMRGFTLVSSAHWLRDVSKEIFNPQHPVL